MTIISPSLYANNVISIDSICTQPITMNSKIVTVCNDINFSNRVNNHAIHLNELDQNLVITNHTKLDINNSDIGRLIKVNEKNAYLLAETHSECIQVLDLNIEQQQAHSLLKYCDSSPLSLPYEVYKQSIILSDQSLFFPVLFNESNQTTVKVIRVNKQKKYQVLDIPEYINYIPISFVKFIDKSILLLRSKDDPEKSVLLSFRQDGKGNMKYSLLYDTSTFLVLTVSNANEKILIVGNNFEEEHMYFSIYEVEVTGNVKKLLDKEPLPFRPAFVKMDETSMELYGAFVDATLQALAVGIFQVESLSAPELKLKSLKKISTDKYPLLLITPKDVTYIIIDKPTYLLSLNSTKQQKKQLKYSNVSGMLYPSLFHLFAEQYLFYIIKDSKQYKSVIEKL